MKNPLLSSAFTVLIFWWLILAIFDGSFTDIELGEIVYNLTFIGVGFLVGAVSINVFGYLNRGALEGRLAGKSHRGLAVTMGMLPILKREPKRAGELPNIRRLNIPEVEDQGFLDQWRERWKGTHPHHVALLDAVLKVMQTKPDAPATHLKDGHGGRTLLQHAILTGFLMERIARSWTWEGNRSKGRNKQILIPLRNANYKFNPDDPLIMIAAVCHDLGKLECYVYNAEGEVVGSKHEHDIVSSQMLARLPEIWSIADLDREVLLLSVGHYHHVPDMPMESKNKPIDDRLMALTELIIHCDTVASKLEQGKSRQEAEAEADDSVPTEAKQDTLLSIFSDIVGETDRINGDDTRYRVGQKNSMGGKPYLFFHERSLLMEIAERSGLDAMSKMGDGQFRLTRDLLSALDEQGVLYKIHEGKEYGAVSALWKVEFRKKNGDFLANWPAAIIVQISDTFLPALLALDDSDVIPLIKGPVHGEQRAKKGNTGLDLESLTALDAEKMLTEVALRPGTPKPTKQPSAPAPAATPPATPAEPPPDWAMDDAGAPASPPSPPADPAPAPEPVPPPVVGPTAGDAAAADTVSTEAIEVCELIVAGGLPKAVAHPHEEGIFVVRANHLTPFTDGFSWLDAAPSISAGLVPGVRCVIEGEDDEAVLFLLFNPSAVLANQTAATAFNQTGDLPAKSKDEAGGDPW